MGNRYPPAKKDSLGRTLCRGCGKVVTKPRRTWCSDECYRLYNGFRPQIYERDNGICQICGRVMERRNPWILPEEANVDHIIPLVDGGKHSWNNMQLLCVDCHKRKTAKEASKRSQKNKRLTEESKGEIIDGKEEE